MVRRTFVAAVSVLSFTGFFCKGELPPYQDPTDILDAHLDINYVLSITSNSLRIYFVVVNSFDETLQGSATIDGQAGIVSARDFSVRRTFLLSAANIVYARAYNSVTRELTIDPGDSVKLESVWNFIDDNGMDLTMDFFRYRNDPTCSGRRIALPEVFLVSGELKVFDRLKTLNPRQKEIRICHVSAYVPANYCPPVFSCPE